MFVALLHQVLALRLLLPQRLIMHDFAHYSTPSLRTISHIAERADTAPTASTAYMP